MRPILAAVTLLPALLSPAGAQQLVTPARQTAMVMGQVVGTAISCNVPSPRLEPLIAKIHDTMAAQAADEDDRKFSEVLFADHVDEALAAPMFRGGKRCQAALTWIKQLERDFAR